MLKIKIPPSEIYNEKTNLFVYNKEQLILLEHSLVSISKWESKWEKAFLTKKEKTEEETLDYINCMIVSPNIDDITHSLNNDHVFEINKYIEAAMSATKLPKQKGSTGRDVITSELIYYWMVALNIPFECQKWHLNRLLTLINVCNIKNAPPKKMGKRALANRNKTLNEQRKQSMNTRG